MADTVFSLPSELFASAPGPDLEAVGGLPGERRVSARWRRRDGSQDAPVDLGPVRIDHVEFPDGNGAMGSSPAAMPPTLESVAPADAVALDLTIDGAPVASIELEGLFGSPAALPQPAHRRIGTSDAHFVVPVFSERFADAERFFGFVGSLHDWIATQPPFDGPGVAAKLAFDAYFWASDPVDGLFATQDAKIIDGRLFFGDRALARTLLAPWVKDAPLSLILIDSILRGGAGGSPGYSAWTSITAAPGERWEAVCLHEIGHGLGLADEYVDSQRASENPAQLEPNVSNDPRPSQAPWHKLCTVSDTPSPTLAIGANPTVGADAVGTFQGARYRSDFYRPSRECLMLNTGQKFCAVCRAHILTVL
jgi:hypothetical protein